MSVSGSSQQPRRPTYSDGDGTKPSKPDLYYGERNKLNSWLLQMDLYFRLTVSTIQEKDKVPLAATFMRGKALNWINSDLQKYLDGDADEDIKKWMEKYSLFKKKIQLIFGPANEEANAESIIQRLKQTKSAADYATSFQHYAAMTNWNDEAQMSMFKRGLRDNVQDELMRYSGEIEDLGELMKASIELDDKLHQRSIERRENQGGRFTGRSTWGSGSRGNREPWGNDMRGDPMELDVLKPQDRGGGERTAPRKCYTCGKPGHIARNCRSKNMVHRPQLNVLSKLPQFSVSDQETITDWTSVGPSDWETADEMPSSPPITPEEGPGNWITNLSRKQDVMEIDDSQELDKGKQKEETQNTLSPGETSFVNLRSAQIKNGIAKRAHWTDEQRNYGIDKQNLHHALRHWTFCFDQYCMIHDSEKRNVSWEPKCPAHLRCHAGSWISCPEDKCANHLIDKRRGRYFYGHLEEFNARFQYLCDNDNDQLWCKQQLLTTAEPGFRPIWQFCVTDSCPEHREDKIKYGVLSKTEHLYNLQTSYDPAYDTYIALSVIVKGCRATALLDTGAMTNFISSNLVNKANIWTKRKHNPYELVTATGGTVAQEGITRETVPTKIAIQQHNETLTFDVLGMATHDFILGMPWLKKHNPVVDWRAKQLRFQDGLIVKAYVPGRFQTGIQDERTHGRHQGMCFLAASKQGRQDPSPAPAKTDRGPSEENARSLEGSDRTLVPHQYREWKHLFEEDKTEGALPKHQPWDHQIKLMEGKEPTFGPIYQLSEIELKALDEYLKVNLAKGFIRPSTSSAGYPILFIPKKNGKLRMCVDYRKLNDITVKNRYPLPNANELRDRLQGAQWFTKLDMRGAYNQIRVAKGHEWKTAFRTRYGSYEYLVMPFGLTNAPASCQELINNTLRNVLDKSVIAYLDDILIFSQTLDQHQKDVKTVLTLLDQQDLLLEPDKCEFTTKKVAFLGYIVTPQGIGADPEKIQAVLDWPPPTTVKELQSFLGTINFNRKFIKGFSEIALPLTTMTKKDKPYIWGKEQQLAFDNLKRASTNTPVLRTFQTGKPIRIETDASDTATGACLLQQFEGNWHPIAYYSRKLTDTEQNYDIHDKELMAIVLAFQQWRMYAEGATDIEVLTDHKNLIYFTTTKQLNRRQTRWSEQLGQYKFRITYTPGKDNQTADGLSRRPDLYQEKAENNVAILQQRNNTLVPVQQLNVITFHSTDDFMTKVRQAYQNDHLAQEWIKERAKLPLQYMGKNYVPASLTQDLVKEFHDNPKYGHPGVTRTMGLIARNYASPRMRTEIERYISTCRPCCQNKAENHVKYGYLQKIKLPEFPWNSLTMDFITKLPPSQEPTTKEIYDAIMVVVDRHTKYTSFIPFNETYDAVKLGYVFLDKVVRIRGFPQEVISDRDKLFTSSYWKTVTGQLGIKLKLSSAYHPQTDGQTERTNRTLKTYLRHYCTVNQTNWVSLLPIAELANNNLLSRATGTTPFFANYGRHPNMMDTPKDNPRSQQAIEYAQDLLTIHKGIQNNLEQAQNKMEEHENKFRLNGPQLKEGDKVWLHTKNLRTKRPSKKLDHVRVGPFRIKANKGPVNYELELPEDAKIFPTFHVSLLEKASDDEPVATRFGYEPEEENVYEVERILLEKDGQYLIKWKGYPHSENTWEPEEHLLPNCAKLLRRYRQQTQLGAPIGRNQGPRPNPSRLRDD